MNIALQFKWRDNSRRQMLLGRQAWVKPGSVYMHGSKPRLEVNRSRASFFWGGGRGFMNLVSIKVRGLRAISAGLAPVPRTAFLL